MKKRIVSIVLSVVLVAAMSVGCGSASSTETPQTTDETVSNDVTEVAKISAKDFSEEIPESNDYATLPNISDLDISECITLGEYKGLSVSLDSVEVTAEELQEKIDMDLASHTTQEVVIGRKVQDGDIVNIDYEGKKDGVAFDGGTAQGFDLEIGSGTFIPGFEDGLIGASKGETLDLNLTFPEQYQSAELAGQEVVFTVTVNEIKQKVVPELTDEVVKSINEKYTSVDDYKKAIEEKLKIEKEESANSKAKEELLQKAIDASEITYMPGWVVRQKTDLMRKSAEKYAQNYGITFDDFLSQVLGQTEEMFLADCVEYAKEDAKQAFVIYAIAEAEGIVLDKGDLELQLRSYSQAEDEQSYQAFKLSPEGKTMAEYIQMDTVTQWLLDNANIEQ